MSPEPAPPPVESCLSCGLVMDLSEVSPLTVVECPSCRSPQTVFQKFGPFHLERLLGTGGMGAVYRARDLALERPIALKVLQKKLSHDRALTAQFEREAALTARVNHPHVVRVYSTGAAHGMFYIAMELVDRGSLDGVMEGRGRLPEEEVLGIGIQVAEGLRAADAAGLIHRDIKPGNILFGESGQAKIVDFGLALQANLAHTHGGEIWGTPYYISPEALAMKAEDFRSDMYALGASLWHALTGAPPHLSSSVSVNELLLLKKQPVDLGTTFPGTHPLTVAALNRTLLFDPGQRFSDYESLISSLREALAALTTQTAATASIATPVSGKKSAVRRAALIGLVAALAGGAWWWQTNGARREEPAGAEPSFQSDEERLSHSIALLGKPGQMELAVRRLDLVAASPALSPELQVWTQFSRGIAALLEGDTRRADTALKRALEHAEAGSGVHGFVTQLAAQAPVPSEKDNAAGDWEPLRKLWLGLSALNRHQFREAQTFLENAARSGNAPPAPCGGLLSLAPLLLTQVHNFQALEAELEAASKNEARSARLRKAEELLQSMHPAVFLRARAGELLAQTKAVPVRTVENTPPAPPPKAAPATPPAAEAKAAGAVPPARPPSLERVEALRTKASQYAQNFQFKEALDATNGFSAVHEAEKNAVVSLQRQIMTAQGLFLWAIQEVNRGGTLPSPILRNGSAFKSDPIKADATRVLVAISPGTPPIPVVWTDISPLYLVKLVQFRLTTQPSHPQRAEFLWGAGHMHLLLGSRQNAKPFLEEAARLNPAYTALLTAALADGQIP